MNISTLDSRNDGNVVNAIQLLRNDIQFFSWCYVNGRLKAIEAVLRREASVWSDDERRQRAEKHERSYNRRFCQQLQEWKRITWNDMSNEYVSAVGNIVYDWQKDNHDKLPELSEEREQWFRDIQSCLI